MRFACHLSPSSRAAEGGSSAPCTGKTDVANESALRSACSCRIVALGGSAAVAQNLDQGKPAPKLFAESCASCHRSPRGLAKGRFHLTLYLFLQKHYSSGSSSAWALTSYLESIDSGKRAAAKPAGEERRVAVALVAAAGAGAGAIGAGVSHDLLTAALRNLLSPAIFSTFAGLAS